MPCSSIGAGAAAAVCWAAVSARSVSGESMTNKTSRPSDAMAVDHPKRPHRPGSAGCDQRGSGSHDVRGRLHHLNDGGGPRLAGLDGWLRIAAARGDAQEKGDSEDDQGVAHGGSPDHRRFASAYRAPRDHRKDLRTGASATRDRTRARGFGHGPPPGRRGTPPAPCGSPSRGSRRSWCRPAT